ncbi:hypothetical protein GCM10009868_16070 [Terrabacter aerolatus]|uniref:O-antigen ligase-related domain-containing protein n=1 Tax=Terrabacter aerolatus TaxID=422442 RepID=A0A512D3P8_9MICO|nr:hypothetical protein TAE01_29010 [Terrabacter aerolatus]
MHWGVIGLALTVSLIILTMLVQERVTVTSAMTVGAMSLLLAAAVIGGFGVVDRSPAAVLTLVFFVLYLVPENYVLVGPLKSVGNPALLGGLAALTLWGAGRVLALIVARPSHPIRWTIFGYVVVSGVSLAAAMMRPVTAAEAAGSTRAIFPLLAMIGIAILACDGLASVGEVSKVLQRIVWVGGGAALIGIMEFFSASFNYRTVMKVPIFTTNTEIINGQRSGFQRVDGAAAHPIEYAVALAALVPLAVHFAIHGKTRRARHTSIASLALILAVVPMTVSRSGILAIVVGLVVYGATLAPRMRFNFAVLGVAGLLAFSFVVPGLLGTIRSLITVGSADPSISGRTEDYAKIPSLLDGHWIFGRGLGTFQPLQYFYLDNQYLGSLIEGGLLVLTALILLYIAGMGCARGARRRLTDVHERSLCQAMLASVAALAASSGTYDELSFYQTGFLLFLLLGCIGAVWSYAKDRTAASVGPRAPQSSADRPTEVLSRIPA